MSAKKRNGRTEISKKLQQLISQISCKGFSRWNVFKDFHAMAVLSFRNAADLVKGEAWQAREDEYLRIINSYDNASQAIFPQMLAELVQAMEEKPKDICGRLFEEMDLGDSWKGQFFTPQHVADMIGQLIWGNDLTDRIQQAEFVTIQEPAVGSGVMAISLFNAIVDAGLNPQQTMHVTATDIDIIAVHMAYIQFSLLHIPAVVIHGNALSLKTWSVWPTPAYVLGLWDMKLARREAKEQLDKLVVQPSAGPLGAPPVVKQLNGLPYKEDETANRTIQLKFF